MAHANKVLRSINQPGGPLCVDVFARPEGGFGFEEFRRDPEDPRGWFPVGGHAALMFDSAEAAMRAARREVAWLAEAMD